MLVVAIICACIISHLVAVQTGDWKPSALEHCRSNTDCNNVDHICCSITPALGRRRRREVFPTMVHYCLSYKTADSPWCSIRLQYSPTASNYLGLCPCGPGLKCAPSKDLDPQRYPPDRYGKCTPV